MSLGKKPKVDKPPMPAAPPSFVDTATQQARTDTIKRAASAQGSRSTILAPLSAAFGAGGKTLLGQ